MHRCIEEPDPTLQVVRVRLARCLEDEVALGSAFNRIGELRCELLTFLLLFRYDGLLWEHGRLRISLGFEELVFVTLLPLLFVFFELGK